MNNVLKNLFAFFDKSDKRYSVFLLAMMLFTAFVELAGIGSLFPYIKILGDKNFIYKNNFLNTVFNFFNFKNANNFLVFVGFSIFFMLVLKAVMSTLNNYYQARLTCRINNRLSEYCLNSYMRLPYVETLNQNSAILSKHLLVDVSSISTMIQALLIVTTDLIVTLSLVALMVWVDPWLVISVVCSLGVLLLVINHFLKRRIKNLAIANEHSNRYFYKTASEALSSLKDINIYRAQDYFLKRYLKWQHKISHQTMEFSVVSNLPTNILNVMGFGVLLIVLLYLIMTRGNLLAILPTIGLIAVSVQRLLPAAARISVSIANIRRYTPLIFVVRDAIDEFSKKSHQKNLGQKAFPELRFTKALALSNITYRYPGTEKKALDTISLVIEKNSSVGIVGESGAGKSTLVDVLLGLLPVDSGSILFDGIEVNAHENLLLSNCVGYVPQQVQLLDSSMRENIVFGINSEDVNENALKNAITIAQLKDFVEQLPEGLETQIGEKGVKLSGGQRQRIGIARALYRDPDILILDEATNALDAATEKEFNDALTTLMKKKTLIIIAHRLSSVQICDHIVQLEKGRVVAEGSYDEMIKNSQSFRRIYNLMEV